MKFLKKGFVSLALCAMLVIPLICATSAYENVSGWAVEEVGAMEELGLIPETMYEADLTEGISRMDMCRIAVASYEKANEVELEIPYETPFVDCDEEEAAKAWELGLIQGDGDGMFRPDDVLTRAEFFTFIGRFLNLSGVRPASSSYSDLSQFADAGTLPAWALDHTRLAVGMGVVKGDGEALNWEGTTSGQEALVMFYRSYNVAVEFDLAEVFTDLSPWAAEAVIRMDQMGLIPDGVRDRSMTGSITRGDLCRMVMRSYKLLTQTTDEELGVPDVDPFSDTDDPDILNAWNLGIINGRDNGTFGPDDPITRQDFFKIAANFLVAVDYWYAEDVMADLTIYHDSDEIAPYAEEPIELLVGLDLVNGDDTRCLNPTDNIISQEAVVVFSRIYDFYVAWSEDPVEPEPYLGQRIVETAMDFLGCAYVSGGRGPYSFDCSGFVYYIYKQYDYTLNPGAQTQWHTVDNYIEYEDLLPGDLVFFSSNSTVSGIFHVGIYIGGGEFIHASTPSTGVIISSIPNSNYYSSRYYGAQRPLGSDNLN